jgi:Na+/H+ antiporter NhaD/arsenite permease-like protein
LILSGAVMPGTANAAGSSLDGAALGWPWALPFIGILLTIASGPLLSPHLWHRHYGALAFAWALATLVPLAVVFGTPVAIAVFAHGLFGEYLSFIVLLFALYVVAGGILVTGNLRATPLVNLGILVFGTVIASIVGTTGAAMILIRPLLRANSARLHNAHVVIFFIILVGNISGALSPLGNPPLFIGFLHGVHFFWSTQHLFAPTALMSGMLLLLFLLLDFWFHRKDRLIAPVGEPRLPLDLRVRGTINLALIAAIIAATLGASWWRPGISFDVFGTPIELQNLVRDALLLSFAFASLKLAPEEHRRRNGFTWDPIIEVAVLFAGIFTCIIPVMEMLRAGQAGAFAWLFAAVTDANGAPRDWAYLWLSGVLSAFLDNAPTYLAFFELAGGDAPALMTTYAGTLAAISMGAVYMGSLTYIGNAPNLMIYAIALERGVKMPSFLGYLGCAAAIVLPALAVVTFVFVAPS